MYRDTIEADRARIRALEQELAEARAALAGQEKEATPEEREKAVKTLFLIFGILFLWTILSVWIAGSRPVDPDATESPAARALREM